MTTATALVLNRPRELERRDLEIPAVGADDGILRIEACGICGSDYEQFGGALRTPMPVIPGHEPLGIIEAIGDAAALRWNVDVGDRVRHHRLGWQGVLERLDRQQAEVAVAGKRLRCLRSELVRQDDTKKSARQPAVTTPTVEVESEINLIGKTVDSAVEQLDRYLDRAIVGGGSRLRVIHGHGTGRLRAALRDYLRTHPAVEKATSAGRTEGGDGATIVTLKGG